MKPIPITCAPLSPFETLRSLLILVPVFGMASAAMIFGEVVSPVEWMGAGLVLAGLGWNGIGGRRAAA